MTVTDNYIQEKNAAILQAQDDLQYLGLMMVPDLPSILEFVFQKGMDFAIKNYRELTDYEFDTLPVRSKKD